MPTPKPTLKRARTSVRLKSPSRRTRRSRTSSSATKKRKATSPPKTKSPNKKAHFLDVHPALPQDPSTIPESALSVPNSETTRKDDKRVKYEWTWWEVDWEAVTQGYTVPYKQKDMDATLSGLDMRALAGRVFQSRYKTGHIPYSASLLVIKDDEDDVIGIFIGSNADWSDPPKANWRVTPIFSTWAEPVKSFEFQRGPYYGLGIRMAYKRRRD